MRVGIVDDHLLFRKSFTLLMQTFENVQVVIEASNGNEIIDLLEDNKIDLLLLDLDMPQCDGYEVCEYVKRYYPEVKILIVSQLTNKESIHKVMDLGAHGYFTKNTDPSILKDAIYKISTNDFYFGQDLGTVIKEALVWEKKYKDRKKNDTINISEKELQVVKLACKEYSTIEIADKLNISHRTVETHRRRLMEKTNAKNFIGAIIYVFKFGHLDIDRL